MVARSSTSMRSWAWARLRHEERVVLGAADSTVWDHFASQVLDVEHHQARQSEHLLREPVTVIHCQGLPSCLPWTALTMAAPRPQWWILGHLISEANPPHCEKPRAARHTAVTTSVVGPGSDKSDATIIDGLADMSERGALYLAGGG